MKFLMIIMGDWINVKAKDVITILEKAKTGFPWGNYPNEKYRCLIFWYKNRINMTVNEFSDEQLASKAYNAWCTGAR
jgi:hypothetical protein